MVEFEHTVIDPMGLHARPAGVLAAKAKEFTSRITLNKNGAAADARRVHQMMKLQAACGEKLTITVEGEDEQSAAEAIKTLLKEKKY